MYTWRPGVRDLGRLNSDRLVGLTKGVVDTHVDGLLREAITERDGSLLGGEDTDDVVAAPDCVYVRRSLEHDRIILPPWRDSNPRPSLPESDALPLSYRE